MVKLTTMKKEKWIFKRSWIIFYFDLCFELTYEICGYFDNRPRFNINLIFFRLALILPFRNKWTDECDSPKWGISIHHDTLWIHQGGKGNLNGGSKWWVWHIPFFTMDWVRTSILLDNDVWEHETLGNRKSFYNDHWKQKQKVWKYEYTDSYDGTVIPTLIYIEEQEWRPKWLHWTRIFAKISRSIDIYFSQECGKGKKTWKGGVTGCSYKLLKNEDPIQCIKRMEKERIF